MSVHDKLKELGITLPPVATPAAAYVPYVRTGNLVFLSGHIARKDGKPIVGQLGKTMTTEEGKAAARAVAARDQRAAGGRPRGSACVRTVAESARYLQPRIGRRRDRAHHDGRAGAADYGPAAVRGERCDGDGRCRSGACRRSASPAADRHSRG